MFSVPWVSAVGLYKGVLLDGNSPYRLFVCKCIHGYDAFLGSTSIKHFPYQCAPEGACVHTLPHFFFAVLSGYVANVHSTE